MKKAADPGFCLTLLAGMGLHALYRLWPNAVTALFSPRAGEPVGAHKAPFGPIWLPRLICRGRPTALRPWLLALLLMCGLLLALGYIYHTRSGGEHLTFDLALYLLALLLAFGLPLRFSGPFRGLRWQIPWRPPQFWDSCWRCSPCIPGCPSLLGPVRPPDLDLSSPLTSSFPSLLCYTGDSDQRRMSMVLFGLRGLIRREQARQLLAWSVRRHWGFIPCRSWPSGSGASPIFPISPAVNLICPTVVRWPCAPSQTALLEWTSRWSAPSGGTV